ncbi:MAG: relaxase/mobilization nuclease domain-containing protein [Sphingobacteriales bacterium]|nr:relaxase/mobilization nuclease domain-containing protein [Sphingobacteriales bacterium]
MFAKVRGNASIRSTLYYNDKKVRAEQAEIIHAANFIKDAGEMSKKDILDRFDQRISLNRRTIKPVAHIPIGFNYVDKLSNEQMKLLSDRYMEGIGFAEQPYLVYRHYDVVQPHMHIVTTNIREDGSRIELRDIIFWRSRQVADALADEFSLRRCEKTDVHQKAVFEVKEALAVDYGKTPTHRAMSDVLNTVVEHYKYDNLAELNAAFRLYNMTAYRGKESSHLYKVGGLLYQALDEKGRRIGCPIQASHFFLKPTLPYLQRKFVENRSLKESSRQRVGTAVDWVLAGTATNWAGFVQSMEREGISVVLQKERQREEVFFVDHRGKAVFSGESLGSGYNLSDLRQQMVERVEQEETLAQRHHLRMHL